MITLSLFGLATITIIFDIMLVGKILIGLVIAWGIIPWYKAITRFK